MNITGVPLAQLDRLGDRFTAVVFEQIDKVLADTASRGVTLSDVAVIPTLWAQVVDDTLMPDLGDAYWTAVDVVHHQIDRALTAAAEPPLSGLLPAPWEDPHAGDPTLGISRVTSPHAEQYLKDARNRLVGIGDNVWMRVQQQLLISQVTGEGIGDAAARITDEAASISRPRAEVIARTEINGAANAGSIAQVRAAGMPGTKEWVAAHDDRTRIDHAEADGQKVPIDGHFMVGGWAMDHPHDHAAPAGETINCRCTMAFDLDEEQLPEPVTLEGNDAYKAAAAATSRPPDEDTVLALYGYGGGDYKLVNSALRATGGDLNEQSFAAAVEAKKIKGAFPERQYALTANTVEAMDGIFDCCVLPTADPMVAWRGVHGREAAFGSSDISVGNVFTDYAYISTSTDSGVAQSFLGPGDALIRINVPAGSRALSMSAAGGKTKIDREKELVLQRGSKFRVTGITPATPGVGAIGGKPEVIDVELMP